MLRAITGSGAFCLAIVTIFGMVAEGNMSRGLGVVAGIAVVLFWAYLMIDEVSER